jgi:hypothetical protein
VKEKREEKREAGDNKTRKAKRTKEEVFLWFFRGKRQKFFSIGLCLIFCI